MFTGDETGVMYAADAAIATTIANGAGQVTPLCMCHPRSRPSATRARRACTHVAVGEARKRLIHAQHARERKRSEHEEGHRIPPGPASDAGTHQPFARSALMKRCFSA